jgi:hypothetical protein
MAEYAERKSAETVRVFRHFRVFRFLPCLIPIVPKDTGN